MVKDKKKSLSKKVETNCEIAFKTKCKDKACSTGGCIHFLGFIGASVYYISTTNGFWIGVWGVIKAMVWPAFLVYGLMKSLGL